MSQGIYCLRLVAILSGHDCIAVVRLAVFVAGMTRALE
jgi:hypothetical protein